MRAFTVGAPAAAGAPAAGRTAGLGRLGPVLERLAGLQGGWPPHVPLVAREVLVHERDGAAAGTPAEAATESATASTVESATESATASTVESAVEAGAGLADDLADDGVDLLVLGADGNAVPGLVAAAVLLGLEPVAAVGTSSGAAWSAQVIGVRDGLRTARQHARRPADLVVALGSPGLGRLTGLLAQSAVRRTPVLLDGSTLVAGAAVLAEGIAPGAARWWLAGQAPPAPAAAAGLHGLGLTPLLDLGLDRPEGARLAHLVLVEALGLLHPAGDGG